MKTFISSTAIVKYKSFILEYGAGSLRFPVCNLMDTSLEAPVRIIFIILEGQEAAS